MRLARARWQRAELASGHKYWLVWGLESQWMLPLGQTSWNPEAPFWGGKNKPARHGWQASRGQKWWELSRPFRVDAPI
jgi:hypothetical protein